MILSVLVIPNAKQSEFAGWHDGALKIRLAAPPLEGRANEELVRFLAERIGCSKSEIEIAKGLASKRKRVSIPIEKDELEKIIYA